MTPPAGRRTARLCANPPTLETLRRLGELLCAPDEVALILGSDQQRLEQFLARSRKARAAFAEGRGQGLEALRRKQFKLAETNASMAIFLGKTYLDQADRRELEHSGATDLSHARQRVRDKLAALAAAARAQGGHETQ